MEKLSNKTKHLIETGLILFIVLFLGVSSWITGRQGDSNKNDINDGKEPSQSELNYIEFEGKQYSYNQNLFNILLIGTDGEEDLTKLTEPGNAGQADVLILLSMDKDTKEVSMYQIPRDTMTEVDTYDKSGNPMGTEHTQIAYQYAYSIGGTSSCWAVEKTVSELLCDITIDGYIAMNVGGIPFLNDALGGVTMTIPEDYQAIDPQFEKDAQVTLTGEQALKYLHYQEADQSFANQKRMERQFLYIAAFLDNMAKKGAAYQESIYPIGKQYVLTNLSESQIDLLQDMDYADSTMEFIPGEWKEGEAQDEYHVNEDLQKMIVKNFYKQINKSVAFSK